MSGYSLANRWIKAMRENRSIRFRESVSKAIVVNDEYVSDYDVLLVLRLIDSFGYENAHVIIDFDGNWKIRGSDRMPYTIFYNNPESLLCINIKHRNTGWCGKSHNAFIDVPKAIPGEVNYNPDMSYGFYKILKGLLDRIFVHDSQDVLDIVDAINTNKSSRLDISDTIKLSKGTCRVGVRSGGLVVYYLLDGSEVQLDLPCPLWSNSGCVADFLR